MSKKNKDVHAYWHSKALNETDEMTALIGEQAVSNILETEGEHCYACGRECHLQKAHIIPDALGGSAEPENLFLLCIPCHQANPDTIYPDMFFRFIKRVKPFYSSVILEIHSTVSSWLEGATEDEVDKFNNFFNQDYSTIKAKLKVNPDEINVGLNSALSQNTVASLLWKRATA